MKHLNFTIFLIVCLLSTNVKAQINWNFENDDDHGFTLWSVIPATPAADDPAIAGDEELTGIGGDNGLPAAGNAWSIGPPNQYDGLIPAIVEGGHIADGLLKYATGTNDPFKAATGNPNSREQMSYLNTYNLNQWGDNLHVTANDQIATSPPVLLSNDAILTVWSQGGGRTTVAPALELDPSLGYIDGSSGIAVLNADDKSLLASLLTRNQGTLKVDTLDLSAFAGQTVVIEVVDAFQGGWGWLAIDEIEITNATIGSTTSIENKSLSSSSQFELAQNFPNPFNSATQISYRLKKNAKVELNVYNIQGQNVANLVNEYQKHGNHNVVWNASNVKGGVYFYKMKVDDTVVTKKMIFTK